MNSNFIPEIKQMDQYSEKNIIEIHNLTKSYGKTRGIENLSLKIKKGMIFGFLGPNGAGKTTTIRCLLGILGLSSGSISIFGRQIKNWNYEVQLKEEIGYLPGEFDLYSHLSVREILDYFVSLRKKPAIFREKLTNLFDLDVSKKTNQLSRGNKQKVGLIQALMHDPDLIILDEPTSGLDPLMQQRLFSFLKELKKRNKTIFFSSHHLDEVQKLCDEVAVIKDGKLVSHDFIDQLSQKIQRKLQITLDQPINPKILEKFPFIDHYEELIRNGSSNSSHCYILWLQIGKIDYSELFDKLNHEFVIRDLSFPETSLEDYFLHFYKEN